MIGNDFMVQDGILHNANTIQKADVFLSMLGPLSLSVCIIAYIHVSLKSGLYRTSLSLSVCMYLYVVPCGVSGVGGVIAQDCSDWGPRRCETSGRHAPMCVGEDRIRAGKRECDAGQVASVAGTIDRDQKSDEIACVRKRLLRPRYADTPSRAVENMPRVVQGLAVQLIQEL